TTINTQRYLLHFLYTDDLQQESPFATFASRMNVRSIEMDNVTDKKKAIFESTLELIKENGFHGTPMSLVAKNACVAAGTIYHYFKSKDELICELYAYNRGRIIE